jgi:hypothetical protein
MKENFCFSHVLKVGYLKYLYEISKVDCSYVLFRTEVHVSHFTVSSDINLKKLTVKFTILSFHCVFVCNRSCVANITFTHNIWPSCPHDQIAAQSKFCVTTVNNCKYIIIIIIINNYYYNILRKNLQFKLHTDIDGTSVITYCLKYRHLQHIRNY